MLAAFGLAALIAGSAAPPPPPLKDAAIAALDACLSGARWQLDASHFASTATEAPGLPPRSLIARIPTRSGRLFAYQDSGGHVIECGFGVYGDASPIDQASIEREIGQRRPNLRPAPTSFWRFDDRPDLQSTYWGDPLGPGLYGVLLRQAPVGDAPTCELRNGCALTLQVDSHSILVR